MSERIAGVDEAGRGPLAGPVMAAAVIFPPKIRIIGLKDSKQLSGKKREQFAEEIKQKALAWAIGRAEVEEIDRLNILQATLLAMQRAVKALSMVPTVVWIDGLQAPLLKIPTRTLIRGDQLMPVISAASILAKVHRDAEMRYWHSIYPEYGFEQHKGYPTEQHAVAIRMFGKSPIHRMSFHVPQPSAWWLDE